jgi:hypothetical protein
MLINAYNGAIYWAKQHQLLSGMVLIIAQNNTNHAYLLSMNIETLKLDLPLNS